MVYGTNERSTDKGKAEEAGPPLSKRGRKRRSKRASAKVISFGKHVGKRYCDLPAPYLKWMAKNMEVEQLRDAAKDELGRRYANGTLKKKGRRRKAKKEPS